MSDRITQATATAGYGVSESASKVLRNTYMLLSLTLFFSAGMTALAVSLQAPPMHWLLSLGGMIGLLFALQAMRNSVWALPLVFAFTGFMGWSLGPMISYYLQSPGGASVVGNALFGTAAVFHVTVRVCADNQERLQLHGRLLVHRPDHCGTRIDRSHLLPGPRTEPRTQRDAGSPGGRLHPVRHEPNHPWR